MLCCIPLSLRHYRRGCNCSLVVVRIVPNAAPLCTCAVLLLLLCACCCVCCSVRRLSVEQLIAEDAALEKSCTDALSFVRTCEQLRGYNKQVQPGPVSGHTAVLRRGWGCRFNNVVRCETLVWCDTCGAWIACMLQGGLLCRQHVWQ
jgi:hypothetical protein